MENFIKKIVQGLKLKVAWKRPVPGCVEFEDFFLCEKLANILGFKILKDNSKVPLNKWAVINGILNQLTLIVLMMVLLTSIVSSSKSGRVYAVVENILISGILLFTLTKIFVVFYKNKTKIVEVTEKLRVHFPHSGVD